MDRTFQQMANPIPGNIKAGPAPGTATRVPAAPARPGAPRQAPAPKRPGAPVPAHGALAASCTAQAKPARSGNGRFRRPVETFRCRLPGLRGAASARTRFGRYPCSQKPRQRALAGLQKARKEKPRLWAGLGGSAALQLSQDAAENVGDTPEQA